MRSATYVAVFFLSVPHAFARSAPAATPAVLVGPEIVERVTPVFPENFGAQGYAGSVILRGTVLKSGGKLHGLQILSGPAPLTRAAVRAVSQWTYKPATLDSRPVDWPTKISIKFSGDSQNSEVGIDESGMPRSATGVLRLPAEDAASILVRKVPAEASAVAGEVKGAVVLMLTVATDGKVENAIVIAGPEFLKQAASNAAKQWVYRPLIVNGKPSSFQTTASISFP